MNSLYRAIGLFLIGLLVIVLGLPGAKVIVFVIWIVATLEASAAFTNQSNQVGIQQGSRVVPAVKQLPKPTIGEEAQQLKQPLYPTEATNNSERVRTVSGLQTDSTSVKEQADTDTGTDYIFQAGIENHDDHNPKQEKSQIRTAADCANSVILSMQIKIKMAELSREVLTTGHPFLEEMRTSYTCMISVLEYIQEMMQQQLEDNAFLNATPQQALTHIQALIQVMMSYHYQQREEWRRFPFGDERFDLVAGVYQDVLEEMGGLYKLIEG